MPTYGKIIVKTKKIIGKSYGIAPLCSNSFVEQKYGYHYSYGFVPDSRRSNPYSNTCDFLLGISRRYYRFDQCRDEPRLPTSLIMSGSVPIGFSCPGIIFK
ncbi:unnamed protein product, partial [Adineta ricciae]